MKDLTPLQMQYLVISMNVEAEEMEEERNDFDSGKIRKGKTPNIAKKGTRNKMKEKIKQRGQ